MGAHDDERMTVPAQERLTLSGQSHVKTRRRPEERLALTDTITKADAGGDFD